MACSRSPASCSRRKSHSRATVPAESAIVPLRRARPMSSTSRIGAPLSSRAVVQAASISSPEQVAASVRATVRVSPSTSLGPSTGSLRLVLRSSARGGVGMTPRPSNAVLPLSCGCSEPVRCSISPSGVMRRLGAASASVFGAATSSAEASSSATLSPPPLSPCKAGSSGPRASGVVSTARTRVANAAVRTWRERSRKQVAVCETVSGSKCGGQGREGRDADLRRAFGVAGHLDQRGLCVGARQLGQASRTRRGECRAGGFDPGLGVGRRQFVRYRRQGFECGQPDRFLAILQRAARDADPSRSDHGDRRAAHLGVRVA